MVCQFMQIRCDLVPIDAALGANGPTRRRKKMRPYMVWDLGTGQMELRP